MYAVSNIWPTLGEELGTDVEYTQQGNLRLGKTEAHRKTLIAHTEKSTSAGLDVKMITGDEAREMSVHVRRSNERKLVSDRRTRKSA